MRRRKTIKTPTAEQFLTENNVMPEDDVQYWQCVNLLKKFAKIKCLPLEQKIGKLKFEIQIDEEMLKQFTKSNSTKP